MFLEILAEERGIREIQIIGNLLHRHIGEAQAALDGPHREVLYHHAWPAIDRLFQDGRQVFGRDIQLLGEIVHLTDTSVALLNQMNEPVSQQPSMKTWRFFI